MFGTYLNKIYWNWIYLFFWTPICVCYSVWNGNNNWVMDMNHFCHIRGEKGTFWWPHQTTIQNKHVEKRTKKLVFLKFNIQIETKKNANIDHLRENNWSQQHFTFNRYDFVYTHFFVKFFVCFLCLHWLLSIVRCMRTVHRRQLNKLKKCYIPVKWYCFSAEYMRECVNAHPPSHSTDCFNAEWVNMESLFFSSHLKFLIFRHCTQRLLYIRFSIQDE